MPRRSVPEGEVTIDSQHRLHGNLRKLFAGHDRYMVEKYPDGTLIFRPSVPVTKIEADLLRELADPEMMAAINAVRARNRGVAKAGA